MWSLLPVLPVILILAAPPTQQPSALRKFADPSRPLIHAHAHNDYEHHRPLAEALEHGFCSIEADVDVIDGKVILGHSHLEAWASRNTAARLLTTLYLDPLKARAEANGGRIYPGIQTIYLLIDLKSDPSAPAYATLKSLLEKYQSILTTWDSAGRHTRAVTVIISGNNSHQLIGADPVRYCASDGKLADLGHPDLSPELCPLISSDWNLSFSWNGQGEMPSDEQQTLRQLSDQAHREGRGVRFWGAPDNLAAWKQLRAADVDLINTDDLDGLQQFLLTE